ncbi:piezo-type mechanosensitive ion channel component 1-like isoform X3 [Asterias amurensis]|uniref:piezo-type mechanosensitive ion channel component 1-like isoform X3 n=1 Tax=Asterias amurensis TaxID=7602 RepID=UPI003AB506D2
MRETRKMDGQAKGRYKQLHSDDSTDEAVDDILLEETPREGLVDGKKFAGTHSAPTQSLPMETAATSGDQTTQDGLYHPIENSNAMDPVVDIGNGATPKQQIESQDYYEQMKPTSNQPLDSDQRSVMSLSELPFWDIWRKTKVMLSAAWAKSSRGTSRWCREFKEWIFSKYFVTWLLLYYLIGSVLFIASFLRYNAVSGVYLLCLLALPLIPNPSRQTMSGRTAIYLIIVIILSSLGCLTQAIFQTILAADSPYGHDWEACNGTEVLWRQLGYQRLDELSAVSLCRLILPDVVLLIVTIVVFVVCKKLFAPSAPPPEGTNPQEASGGSSSGGSGVGVVKRRTKQKSVVAEGIQSFIAMFLCALAAVILPSAISGFYFITFLMVITWWSLYQSWGRRFYHVCIVWLLYSGAHILTLYLYQFPFFQEAVPSDGFYARLFGLKAIINATQCDEPREILIVTGERWFNYVNPGAVLVFYIYLGLLIRCWLDGPEHEVVRKQKKAKRHGEKEVSPQKQRLMDESGPSYQSMDPTSSTEAGASGSASEGETGLERQTSHVGSTKSEEEGRHKMSPFATVVGYITKQCYIAALILMMVWSITYHSWLTFVLLLWAIIIWIIPASTTRTRTFYCSPLLVLYCEALLLIQFVYGLELNDTELPSETKGGVNLTEIGLIKFTDPCIPLGLQLVYTLMLWLTLRQFLREKRLTKMNINSDGIILQPFGMIFSDPDEEMTAITEAQEGGDFVDKGDSETMSVIGTTIWGIFSKYWIFLVGAMFLIVSLQESVDVFKIIYMVLFLLIVNIFLWSFTLFRGLIWIFFWLVVIYSIGVLVLIYTYQFEKFPGYWTNGTGISQDVFKDLGLRQYKTSDLFLNLLIPTCFIIIIMVYIHYFHSKFMDITKIQKSGYKPSKIKEEDDDEEGAGQDEGDGGAEGAKESKSHSRLKLYVRYLAIICRTHYRRVASIIWRCLEIHMSKIVIFTIILVVTREITAVNGALVLLIFLILPLPWFTRLMFLITALWVSVVLFSKMVFQLDLMPTDELAVNCSNLDYMYPLNESFSSVEWVGLKQVPNFAGYVIGYVAILLMMVLWYIAQLRMEHHRSINNLDKPKQSVIFEDVKREQADNGLVSCLKFLANYCFYKFGLEMCFITTVIVSAVRLDALSVIYMVLMLCMIFLKRKTVSYLWPFYTIILVLLLPLTYALALGLPPLFCIEYPWTEPLQRQLITWLYLSDYDPNVGPEGHFIVADFLQLLFVCLQLQVFRIERNRGTAYGGGDNYECTVDVENIAENPVPNFTFNKSYLDTAKSVVFEYWFWVTLAVTFLAGTTRVSLFGLIYIVFSFYFLWLGAEYLIKPTAVVLKRWNRLLFYNLLVIFLKVGLQIMSCVYIKQLISSGACWVLQLLGVVCLQNNYEPLSDAEAKGCTLPVDEAGLTWDVSVFIFLIVQKRIFTSNYFQYVVISLEEEKSLASKGAELINELLATRVRNKRLEERRILEGIKKKTARIKKSQLELTTKAEYTEPLYHDEAIRGQGGYYMFKDLSDEELSDLEPDAIPAAEEAEEDGKHSAFHLVHDAVTMSPEDALKKDDEAKDDEAVDAGEASGTDQVDGGKSEDEEKKGGPLDIVEAEGVLAEIDELEKEEETEGSVGIWAKFTNIVKLVWRVLMRGLEGCIHFFDEISEEYRYVAQELRKLSTEGKRQRSLKHKAKAIEPPPEVEGDGEIEEVPPHEPTRVSIKVEDAKEDADNIDGASQDDALAKVETASTAETSSSEKFVRTMPRPVRFIYALLYAIISQSQLVCFFLIVLNLMVSANILSLPLPILVFTWAMLSVPRPTKRFWVTVITYTQVVVILKYFFQFYFYPWNTVEEMNTNASNPLWWPYILGIDRKDKYAVVDLCILLAAFFHRSILRRHGLWQESQVVPNLDDPYTQEQLAIKDASAEDKDAEKEKKKKKKKKKKTKKSKKTEADEDTPEDADKPGTSAAEGGETATDGDEKDAAVDSSDEEEETKEGIFAPFVSFYNNMLDPTYSAVTDVYVPMFLCDVFNFILFAVMSYSFGEEQAQTDVADMITSNSISMFFVLFLLLQFVLMVIDRAIYLRKAVIAKFIFLIAVIIGVHVWLFFLLPKINNRRFIDNTPAQVFYFVKCIYFALSAYQIRSGYPTRILGNCLCKRYNYINLFLFMGYQAIPFLKEIRMLMDWMFTDTTLSLAHWLEIEDVYSSVYPIKCWRNAEVAYPVDRGLLKSKAVKYGAGGIQLFVLLVIVWFPLLLISLSNSSNISNPISSVDISITISGYDPLFKMTTQGHSLIEFNQKKYDALLNNISTDLTAVSFLKMYKAEDLIVVNITGASASSWDVSPPSRNGLREHLLSMNVVEFRYAYSFKRNSDSSLVTPVVEGFYSFTLSATNPKERKIRTLLAEQLDTNVSSPVAIPRAYPGFVQVPAKGDVEPATKILNSEYSDGYSDITMKLEYGSIDGVGGEREWWVVNKDEDMMSILTFNDRVASDLFAPLAGYGIVGLYVSLVLVVGKFVRMMFSGVSQTIMFKEFPNVDRIVKLCLDIFLVRECGEMKLEEDLTAKLIFLYRSPAMLIEFTRYKRD